MDTTQRANRNLQLPPVSRVATGSFSGPGRPDPPKPNPTEPAIRARESEDQSFRDSGADNAVLAGVEIAVTNRKEPQEAFEQEHELELGAWIRSLRCTQVAGDGQ